MPVYPLEPYKRWFTWFVDRYRNANDEEILSNVRLKEGHTLRVLEEARTIVASLPIEPPLADLIRLAALLHDVGRFPQLKRYGTFADRLSVNHGHLGVRVLRREKVLVNLPRDHRRLVLGAVGLHNAPWLHSSLPPVLDFTVRAVRDADKLDIIPTVIRRMQAENPGRRTVVMSLDPAPDRYTPEILQSAERRGFVDMSKMVWVNDFKLTMLSWLQRLNFAESRRVALERDYTGRLRAMLPEVPDLVDFSRRVERHLRDDIGSTLDSDPGALEAVHHWMAVRKQSNCA